MTQPGNDAVSVIVEDHRAVERVFTELESREGTPERRRERGSTSCSAS